MLQVKSITLLVDFASRKNKNQFVGTFLTLSTHSCDTK